MKDKKSIKNKTASRAKMNEAKLRTFWSRKFWILPLPAVIVLAVIVFGGVGVVGALSGWFGGGNSIPEDSFSRGLVGYWSMDESYGTTTYDGSGNGNNGTMIYMSTSTGGSWSTGKLGSALSFDGVDDFVTMGTPTSLQLTSELTYEAWVKYNSFSANYNPVVISNYWRPVLWRYNTGGGVFRFTVDEGAGGSWNATGSTVVQLNTWYHVVGTFSVNEGKLKVYVNGVLEGETDKTAAINLAGSPFTIGTNYGSGQQDFANGTIDEARVYSRALSAAEIRYHYNRGGPVAHWKFDEGSGTTVYDSTSNNNDGTMYYMSTSTGGGWVQGKNGTALSFDGSDDYVQVSADSDLNPQQHGWTAEMWIQSTQKT
ncbi:MAG: LamG domain-containing protein, partial [Candidatus Omnitrophica bacterium]|nr:LamG domain-containing protein [Candidatus Omnitrophota bacterium]